MSDAYFLYHSIGMYPGKTADQTRALTEFATIWGRPDDAQWGAVLPLRQRFIDRWRAILNAGEGTVTTCESVTQGLHMLVEALPDPVLRGRTVLVAADCFPSNHFLLAGMAEARGFTLKTVPLRQGAAWVEDEDMLAAWTPDVALALLTWVSSTPRTGSTCPRSSHTAGRRGRWSAWTSPKQRAFCPLTWAHLRWTSPSPPR